MKRFTCTDKWKKKFFKRLPSKYKLLWLYILDDCDHAGVWHTDLEVASIRIGEDFEEVETLKIFGDKVKSFDAGEKWFIESFVSFQYTLPLNEKNNAHLGVIKVLKKYKLDKYLGATEPQKSPSSGAQDKEQDKELEKEKVKEFEGKWDDLKKLCDHNKSSTKSMCRSKFVMLLGNGYTTEQIMNCYRFEYCNDDYPKSFYKKGHMTLEVVKDYLTTEKTINNTPKPVEIDNDKFKELIANKYGEQNGAQ